MVGGIIPGRKDPADVRMEKAAQNRRVHIVIGVGVRCDVDDASPPTTELRAELMSATERPVRTERPDCSLECAVGKVPQISRTDRENTNQIECQSEEQGMRT